MKNIMITTLHRGVFLAKIAANADLTTKLLTDLKDVRMVIRWQNGEGLSGMAQYGPTSDCKLAPTCDMPTIHDVTAVYSISPKAASKIWK